MGDFVYAISAAGITATNLTTMTETARLTIEYSSPYNDYVYEEGVAVSDSSETEREEESSSSDGEDRPQTDA